MAHYFRALFPFFWTLLVMLARITHIIVIWMIVLELPEILYLFIHTMFEIFLLAICLSLSPLWGSKIDETWIGEDAAGGRRSLALSDQNLSPVLQGVPPNYLLYLVAATGEIFYKYVEYFQRPEEHYKENYFSLPVSGRIFHLCFLQGKTYVRLFVVTHINIHSNMYNTMTLKWPWTPKYKIKYKTYSLQDPQLSTTTNNETWM